MEDIGLIIVVIFLLIVGVYLIDRERKKTIDNKKIRIKSLPTSQLLKRGNQYSKDYGKYKKTFLRGEITAYHKGKKVKYWKQVYASDEHDYDDKFIPIYYKKK